MRGSAGSGGDGGDDRPEVGRRDFLKLAGAGAGLALAGGCVPDRPPGLGDDGWPGPDHPAPRGRAAGRRVVVIGAGAFGAWTALFLRQAGADVVLVDKYGPGNSRATSGGETRGVRTSYGDRPHGLHWTRWADESIRRWERWDEEWGRVMLPRLFFRTGDLILRPETDNYLTQTTAQWDQLGIEHEILEPGEIARRWSVFRLDDMGVGVYEPRAGVVRARRAIESVARVFERKGGDIVLGEARPGSRTGERLRDVRLASGERLDADAFVFALGPWFPKVFPEVMGRRLRIPMGHVFYIAPPPGDERWRFPNMPSYGVPGVTGWPALPPDHRGVRVRTGGRPGDDPDESDRWIPREHHERPLDFVAERFPDLAGRPINETRACHYELTVDRNFIVDRHPGFDNVWLAGGGSAESFKFGPWTGDYVARRVLGRDSGEPDADEGFRLDETLFDPPVAEDDEEGGGEGGGGSGEEARDGGRRGDG